MVVDYTENNSTKNNGTKVPPSRILISGASIAGLASAWFLSRLGHEIIIIEKSSHLRLGGHSVDLHGRAETIIDQMGLLKTISRKGTGEKGARFLSPSGRVVAEMPCTMYGGQGLSTPYEIPRGELVQLLSDTCGAERILYSTSISGLRSDQQKIEVTCDSATISEIDCVVIAEGIRSSTRERIFTTPPREKKLHAVTAYFTVPSGHHRTNWWEILTLPRGRVATIRPHTATTLSGYFSWKVPPTYSIPQQDLAQWHQTICSIFPENIPFLVQLRKQLTESEDFYCDTVSQIRQYPLHTNNCVLVGDAGYCPSPFTGKGTALALEGAERLGRCFAERSTVEKALCEYSQQMQDPIRRGHTLYPCHEAISFPQTSIGVSARNLLVKFFASNHVERAFQKTAAWRNG